ncbi:rRNA pseudouridine synthase [Patescibacteria group bacterium]|nr:rRNA pseudouridine synthase [Patescibacteria group bacterium]
MLERIQKILSQQGIASRRKAEELILNKKVFVNNKIAKLGDKADVNIDKIAINNYQLSVNKNKNNFIYYILNKPVNFICTVSDKHAKKLVTNLVPKYPKVWPVGRLDKNSTGLIILTNDGELTNKLTHPSFKHKKEYEVAVDKNITDKFLQEMKKGVKLEEGIAKADEIFVGTSHGAFNNKFNIILHQGWKRQIRRMCKELNYKVLELKRVRIEKIKLGDLKIGKYRQIKQILRS